VSRESWDAEVALPTGGPYRLRFDARTGTGILLASHTGSDVLVGDLWVLAGQSNMQGRGDLIDVERPSPLVHSFDMTESWVVAEEPLHRLSTARDPVYGGVPANVGPAQAGLDQPTWAPV
jgi:sialate O-acetylesterase